MESLSELENLKEEPLLSKQNSNPKGGFRTLPFIIANEAFERLASLGLMPNMILYLTREYGMQTAEATNFLLLWSAASNFTPFIGAVLSDSYVGRYSMIAFGSMASLLGMILLWLTTLIPMSKPVCNQFTSSCNNSPTTIQLLILHSSFALMSVGAGGIRSCSLAFGVDQLSKRDKDAGIQDSYFSWYYAAVSMSSLIGLTVVVYIQDNMGWTVGFGIPVILMLLATVSFFLASSFYVMVGVKRNMLSGLAQVLVASYGNRLLQLPKEEENGVYHLEKDSDLLMPTEKLRFLNKACIIRNPLQDLTPDGRAVNPWKLCTVNQVEELKALVKIVPIWTTGIMMAVNLSQGSFLVLEASSMDRHVTSNFQIPSASFGTFMIVSLILWVIIYDRIFVPVASKIKGCPARIGAKQKIGVGLLTSCIALASLALVESIRRKIAIEQGYSDEPQAVVNMSAMWLLPRQVLDGLAEASSVIGQNEFFLTELPPSMSSLASTLSGLGTSVADLVASFFLSVVDSVTGGGGHESWLSSNINKGHYDYYYAFICALSFVNFVYFLYCSKSYGPCKSRGK
ncbi:protein NRT1/ PTR FAMILY 1.2 [Cajanus cajan]|uniref:Peptide transporter At1g52190 family n=1 Tax=Cajanus cajan TaxID=3821 RepID=A0A151TDP6_CAJCA|nr:protein NRT1/ PTR FAMILY 1.2 [Cajanus cajan]XP_020217231.1 protein NRT1/ PTR FAMILY 1.2 [Cajanus cajan]XP_029127800.1 protein NRT1/ PTR FAMILY 1.2 [Cajanus cajan]XP_029127801.1 protein NRT1/ PTR FAMILY 1.2 [Cajanus cajan]XP_029127802.1 protein NRT1/ PTR FAMILY 1.2 [Cajanus cajan]KYP65157.1 putative peptide transporter At1g52190 family [Cajanus cajan]